MRFQSCHIMMSYNVCVARVFLCVHVMDKLPLQETVREKLIESHSIRADELERDA